MHDRTPFLRTSLLAATCLAVAGSPAAAQDNGSDFDISTQIGPDPVLPDPAQSLLPSLKVAEVIGWQDGQTPTVPEGLTITAYATDLANPRTVHTLPNGDVLVVQSRGPSGEPQNRPKDIIRGWIMSIAHGGGGGEQKPSNIVTLLRDTDRDGKVDDRHDLLTGLNSPFGVAWADGTLYVAATDAILAYPYELGQTEITAEPTVLTPLPGGPIDHHWTKDLALSPDGRYLYASVGSNSNIVENGLEAEKGRAAIWQVDRQTGASRVFASGLRNPNGLTFHPETGELYTVVNERDELGPNLVPDYMTSVKDGAFYGWPWSYYGQHVDPRVRPQRPDMVEKAIPPDYALSSHVAALGLTFSYEAAGSALPDEYAHGAFIGEHGSWNRSFFNGYHVVYVPFENGKPSGKAEEVVGGFLDGDQAHGRPVGVGIDGTGALLVADDAGNTVWRVAASNGTVSPQPVGTDGQQMQGAAAGGGSADTAGEAGDAAAGSANAGAEGPGVATPAGGEATPTEPQSNGGSQAPAASIDEQLTGEEPVARPSGDTPDPSQTEVAPATLPQGSGETGTTAPNGPQ
ncbi:PQQ-dependent sugar dehydrogenase [Jiella avicenniae]|uniref:Sorbosone dehydrogenase family protein n=1 Tax=Jiella avicenniae TaxID=2907202 RepID=A0A9X1NY07_9HYPH|nr:sorbosone dehydrogenase family protein [Jiella avicenniae]MCE7026825.1 sorbosone dehydrogenase family protein [Jiella avicenniae]